MRKELKEYYSDVYYEIGKLMIRKAILESLESKINWYEKSQYQQDLKSLDNRIGVLISKNTHSISSIYIEEKIRYENILEKRRELNNQVYDVEGDK